MTKSILLLLAVICLSASFASAQYGAYGVNYGGNTDNNKTEVEEEYNQVEEEEHDNQTGNYGYDNNYEEEEQHEEEYKPVEEEHDNNYGYDNNYEEEHQEEEEYKPVEEEYKPVEEEYDNNYGYDSTDEEAVHEEEDVSYGYYGGPTDANDTKEVVAPTPASQLTSVAVDIHFISGNVKNQFLAWHYCSGAHSSIVQCNIFDSNKTDARLIAIEDVITAEAFADIPEAEKHLWHSHSFSIKNGLFILPGVTGGDKELDALQGSVDTYGKVVDIWDQKSNQPRGTPRLAYGLASEDQVDAKVAAQLDAIAGDGLTWRERASKRRSLVVKKVDSAASSYLSTGEAIQYTQYTQPYSV